MGHINRNDMNELTYRTGTDSRTSRMNLWLLGGRMEEGIVREFGMCMNTLLYMCIYTHTYICLNLFISIGGSLLHSIVMAFAICQHELAI